MKNIRKNIIIVLLIIVILISLTACSGEDSSKNKDPNLTIEEIYPLEALLVNYNTSSSEVIEKLNNQRNKIDIKLNDGSEEVAEAAWEKEGVDKNFDPQNSKTYEFSGKVYYKDLIADVKIDVIVGNEEGENDITGSGTKDNPFIIYNFSGLEKLGQSNNYPLDAYYILGNNIDASPTQDRSYNNGKGWKPIGAADKAFTGNFDGQKHEVSSLYIDRPEEENIGFFGVIKGEDISNLDLINVKITGKRNVGGLSGYNNENLIKNIFVSGEIENISNSGKTGGLIGYSENAVISDCEIQARISGRGYDIGGLIGEASGDNHKIENSSVTGDVYSSESGARVGGLVGSSFGINSVIEDCFASGDVNAFGIGEDIGGLIGKNNQTYLNNNYATGDIKVSGLSSLGDGLGGLIGRNIEADVKGSYASGNVIGDRDETRKFGGLIGHNINGDITNCYSTGNIEGRQSGGGLLGDNDGGKISQSYTLGDVVVNGNNGGGLIGLNDDGEVIDSYSEGKVEGSRGIGGLIGRNYDANILDSYSISRVNGVEDVGGLIGDNSGSFEEIKDCYATGEVIGIDDNIGGLVGSNEYINIVNSYAEGDVKGDRDNSINIGGLIGYNEKGNISYSYAEGDVINGDQSAGGLVGFMDGGDVDKTYALGDVTVFGNYGGGLVGYHSSGSLINSYAKGNVQANSYAGGLVGRNDEYLENCYSLGEVKSDEEIGGLIAINYGEVISSYWNTDLSSEHSDGGYGKTTIEMKSKNTFIDWDFNEIWDINEGDSYPFFRNL